MYKTKEIFIYGAGKYGNLMLRFFTDMGIEVDSFVQSEEPKIKEINGMPVISFNTMISKKSDKMVFISISDQKAVREIEKNIINANKRSNIYIIVVTL